MLSDPDKRKIYDVSGEEGVKQNEAGGGRGPHMNMDDMFSQFFGQGGGGGGFHFNMGGHQRHHQEPQKE